ncbi:MAG: SDR family oxidoreductase [Sphingobacteriales bacterium]|nr:SDR family oxidoreductase [Sphingobacteriales bacterium]OJW05134.1 MAG: short-chain dehydrogenase [Sphingobacteriales bacterium 44-61]
MFSLKGKTAVITGGGSGIGKAISLLFAQQGASVYILDFNKESAEEVAAQAKKEGRQAATIVCDVSNQQQVKEVMDNIAQKTGGIQLLVNNAGIAHVGNVETTTEDDFNRLLAVNVKGVYNCLQAVIPHMKKAGGAILNMASIASSIGLPDRFAYSMSKGAVLGMTLSTARDYISQNIRCNCISPARVHTPFVDGFIAKNYPGKEKEMFEKLSKTQPIGRMAEPSEIANLVLYLCSDEAAFITGCDYPIDGGFIKLNN